MRGATQCCAIAARSPLVSTRVANRSTTDDSPRGRASRPASGPLSHATRARSTAARTRFVRAPVPEVAWLRRTTPSSLLRVFFWKTWACKREGRLIGLDSAGRSGEACTGARDLRSRGCGSVNQYVYLTLRGMRSATPLIMFVPPPGPPPGPPGSGITTLSLFEELFASPSLELAFCSESLVV